MRRTVRIPIAGRQKIEGTLFFPKRAQRRQQHHHPGALFLHGWGNDRQRHLLPAELLSRIGFLSLAIDLRGHGKTRTLGQSVSARDNLLDAMSAYEFLVSRNDVDPKRILVAGYSYGGFLAILLSSAKKARWLVLRSPALYRDEDLDIPKAQIKRRGLMAFRRRKLAPDAAAGLRAAAAIQADVLLIEAERDRVIPHQQIRNYLNAFHRANSVTHRVIRGADHAMSREESFRAAVDSFFHWLTRNQQNRKRLLAS